MSLAYRWARWHFNFFADNRRAFYEDYASALKDGAGGPDRLKKLATRARQRKSVWAPLYEHWLRKMHRMSFARALQHTVPDYEVMVLTSAEEDGRLDEGMEYLSRSIRLSSKIKSAYVMALVSPVIALVVLLGFFLTYALLIAPQNEQLLPLAKWPEISRMLYVFSNFLINDAVGILLVGGMVVWLVGWSLSHWQGRLRAYVDRVPLLPWRGYREREANTFLIAYAILLQSNNYGPKEALERMRQFASPWLGWHLRLMLKRLQLTSSEPARALNTGLFPMDLMDRIEDYAERTGFTKALHMLAFDHGDKQLQIADRRAVVAGVIAMLLVSAVIGLIVGANFEFSQALESYIQSQR